MEDKKDFKETSLYASTWPQMPEKSIFGAAVLEAVRERQTSHSLASMCALGAVSTACQPHINVKLPTGHVVPSSLMLLTIADSGERKTSTHDHFFSYLIEQNFKEITKNLEKHELYEIELSLWKEREKALKKTIQKNPLDAKEQEEYFNLQKQKPMPPKSDRFIYDDITPQSLLYELSQNNRNGCLTSSEGGAIFNSKTTTEVAKFNTLWDGGPIIIDRLNRPSINLKDARLTISSLIQPRIISDFLYKKEAQARGSGFFARLIIAKPDEKSGKREAKVMSSEMPQIKNFQERIKEIFKSTNKDGTERVNVTFTEEAKLAWFEYSKALEAQMLFPDIYFNDKDHANKLIDNASRMAACIQTFESGFSHKIEITLETFNYCWNFVKRASRCFLEEISPESEVLAAANLLVDYLLDKTNKNPNSFLGNGKLRRGRSIEIKIQEIKQYGHNKLRGKKNSETLQMAITLLTKLGHVKVLQNTIRFSESILLENEEPELKNGEQYLIHGLPLFIDQVMIEEPDEGKIRPRKSDIKNYFILVKE